MIMKNIDHLYIKGRDLYQSLLEIAEREKLYRGNKPSIAAAIRFLLDRDRDYELMREAFEDERDHARRMADFLDWIKRLDKEKEL
jgi:hypothetical protein